MKSLLALGLLMVPSLSFGLSLAWNVDSDPTVTGYNVYVGKSSGTETLVADVKVATTYVIPTQTPGTYFAVVKAYNSAKVLSLASNEVTWIVATPTPTPTPTPIPTPITPTGLRIASPTPIP